MGRAFFSLLQLCPVFSIFCGYIAENVDKSVEKAVDSPSFFC
jgi:hypothetical protein